MYAQIAKEKAGADPESEMQSQEDFCSLNGAVPLLDLCRRYLIDVLGSLI